LWSVAQEEEKMLLGIVKRRWFIILASLADLGRAAAEDDVMNHILKRGYMLLDDDYDWEPMENRHDQPRWKVNTAFDKARLVRVGCIKNTHMGWEITEEGERYLRELSRSIAKEWKNWRNHSGYLPDNPILGTNAYLRAVEILQEDGQREQELQEDHEVLTPEKQIVTVERIKRYRWMIDDLKRKYGNRCQFEDCGFTFRKKSGQLYSEGHHLVPLSEDGAQKPDNIVVLCPNHHRMLHYADVEIGELCGGKREVKVNGVSHFIVY
jgi:hypothetical protein